MPVNKDESGRRFVQSEIEVSGTPEEVWRAIATGPGVSAWFVPTQVEEREGGAVTASFGPGMDSVSTITTWDPPNRFVAESNDLGPDAPPVATEWIVETRGGGTCVVRVVHSLFTSSEDWDDQLQGWEYGWPGFFRILRLYLAHFRGQPSTAFQVMAFAPEPTAEAWAALTGGLGLTGAALGQRVKTAPSAPPLGGVVESIGVAEFPELLICLDEPTGGVAHLFPLPMGGQVCLSTRLYLYGNRAAAMAARDESAWQAWMREHFPMSGMPGAGE
jgi:uncharacterized protein YndB with AHSA1/START domain